MSFSAKNIDSAFEGAGTKVGLEIWCIENPRLVPVPKSLYGKFYSGSAYIVLNTILLKSGAPQHDIHYWLGNHAGQADTVLASDKALELDSVLGSLAVQYKEVQGLETGKFLSYFKPCVIPVEGVFSSGLGNLDSESYQVCLLTCKGDHAVHVKEVPFSRSSLNHNEVFILDTASKIFLFSGCNSSIQERAKALEVVQYIKDTKHSGFCDVATIEDGKFVGDPDVGEFWSLFGGYVPIPRDSPSTNKTRPNLPLVKLFWISTQGKLFQVGTDSLNKDMLDRNKCYMLDCDAEIFIWMGRNTLITERKTSISTIEDFVTSQGRSTGTHLTFLTEGSETATFKSYFNSWPQAPEPKLYEEGRGKVAAIFKQQGYNVKELPEEECQLFLDCNGTLKVWRVNGNELSLVSKVELMKLFSADCYIMQYTYSDSGRDENLFYVWLGQMSLTEDRLAATSHVNTILDSTKGNPIVARVVEGKEPLQFFSIFRALIVFKGGMSATYTKLITEKDCADETYDEKKIALFRVQGTSLNNMQAIQVDQVSASLNSSYCYILQTESSIYAWVGNLTSTEDQTLLDKVMNLINPVWQPFSVREGSEPDLFWNALGGKAEHPKEKENRRYIEDPHLFICTLNEGDFKVREIFNFTQDDLTTEDVLVLDCNIEIYVWVGCHSNIHSKEAALTLGLKFLETDILVEGLSLETPIYVVSEGHEPPFFTHFFAWDSSKKNMQGNSFERKLAMLKGKTQKIEVPVRNSRLSSSMERTPVGLRSKPVSSNGFGSNGSPASSVSGMNLNSLDSSQFPSPNSTVRKLFSGAASDHGPSDGSSVCTTSPVVPTSHSGNAGIVPVDGSQADAHLLIFPYERLKVISNDPVRDIDVTKREAYLSDEEFQERFGMTKGGFYMLPKWRQNKLKMSLDLF